MLNGDQFIEMMDTRRRLLTLSYPAEVTSAKAKGRVKVKLLGTGVDVGPLPVMVPAGGGGYRQSSPLKVGARVWVFFPQGNPELGFVLGSLAAEDDALDDEAFTVSFDDGMGLVITKDEAQLKHGTDLIMTIKSDSVTIEKKILAKADIEVQGDLKAKGEVSAGPVKLSEHKHRYTDDGAPIFTETPSKV
jgi:phage baseplate assembly protein gpV